MTYTKKGPFTDNSATPPINSAFLNGLETNNALLDQTLIGTATPEMFIASATKDGSGNVTDWAPAINAAITAGYKQIELAARYYTCQTPIRIPSNSGTKIRSKAGLKGSVLDFYLPAGNDANAAVDVLGQVTGTGYNYAGFTMQDVHIKGNNSVAHGIRMQDLSYPYIENVAVEGFRGAGLLLDVVMDGYINITVQDCGRTSGDYTLLADRGNNAKTLYAPVHLMSHRPTEDHCNMLRITGDMEQNKVSPYVWINDAGAIGLWFDKIHGETRNNGDFGNFDFLLSDGADFEATGMNLAGTLRNAFLLNGYGNVRISGGRSIGNIVCTDLNKNGKLTITNAVVGNVTMSAWAGQHSILDCTVGDISINYPGGGPFFIRNSFVGNISITNAGAGVRSVMVDHVYATTLNAPVSAQNVFVRNSEFTGSVTMASPNSRLENTSVGGTLAVDGAVVSYIPRQGMLYQTAPPQFGFWNTGDKTWNSSPASGQPIGWVCTAGGSPGTWKAFGTIS